MSVSNKIPEDLLMLIHEAIEGIIQDEDVPILEAGLISNKEARDLFIKLSRLNASLTIKYQIDEAFRPIHHQLQSASKEANKYDSNRGRILSQVLSQAKVASATLLQHTYTRYAAVALSSIALTLLYFRSSSPELVWKTNVQIEPYAGVSLPIAANLHATHDAEWQPSDAPYTPTSRSLRTGEIVRLEEGLLQLDFINGGQYLLEGPAVFEVASESTGKLISGRVVATTNQKDSQPVVETRVANIVSHNGRVAVSTDYAGKCIIMALEGDVEVQVGGPAADKAIVHLAEGNSISLESDGRLSASGFPQNIKFTEELPKTIPAFHGDVIWLGNLFDDSTTVSLQEAMETDTFQAAAETIDLGIAAVIDGSLDVDAKLAADGVIFNFTNCGGFGSRGSGLPANDTFRSVSPSPISTTGVQYDVNATLGKKIEEGIGMHANELLTFDLDEIRAAGLLGNQAMRFVADRAGINDTVDYNELNLPSSVYMIAIVSNENEVLAGYINGKQFNVIKRSGVHTFQIDSEEEYRKELITADRYVSFDVPIPSVARYLTLVTVSTDGRYTVRGVPHNSDHSVFSGARLILSQPPQNPNHPPEI